MSEMMIEAAGQCVIPDLCSPDQREALMKIRDWYLSDPIGSGNPVFRLLGAAGTGKTSVARYLPEVLGVPLVHYCAPTGKAVSVLACKGCVPVRTLHSLLMSPIDSEGLWEDIEATRKLLAGDLEPAARKSLTERLKALTAQAQAGPSFAAKGAELAGMFPLLVVDEASMVDAKLLDAILEVQIPVVALGDPYQLPPVKGPGALLSKVFPGVELTQIHRQAEGSDVLDLATRIRCSRDAGFALTREDFTAVSDAAGVLPRPEPGGPTSAIITYTNAARLARTAATRAAWGMPLGRPGVGDIVMCAQNNQHATGGPVLNGMQATVTAVGKEWEPEPGRNAGAGRRIELTLCDDEGQTRQALAYLRAFDGHQGDLWFTKNGNEGNVRGYGLAGETGLWIFGQAVTAHRAQGSEWSRVMVWSDWQDMAMRTPAQILQVRRWLYTAATRARTKVILRKA